MAKWEKHLGPSSSVSRYSDGTVTSLEKALPTEQERHSFLLSICVPWSLKFCIGPMGGMFQGPKK